MKTCEKLYTEKSEPALNEIKHNLSKNDYLMTIGCNFSGILNFQ